MKHRQSYTALIFAVLLLVSIGISFYAKQSKEFQIHSENESILNISPSTPLEISTGNGAEMVVSSLKPSLDVFSGTRDPNTSNVVGYIGYGAFIVYVPDWIMDHWTSEPNEKGSIFTFGLRQELPDRNFSDILINMATSTEEFNANTLYELDRGTYGGDSTKIIRSIDESSIVITWDRSIPAGEQTDIVISEVFLNKTDDARIYHIQRRRNEKMYDTFYLDGAGKTAQVLFSCDETAHGLYAPKIREFVQGMGPGNGPRG
jgi:hypothetical protein